MARRYSSLLLLISLLAFPSFARAQSGIQYVYDELGRLVGVIDQNGDAAAYHYDAVGNLLSITRAGSASLSVLEITPNDGDVGATVTIYGTGFSTTPSQNTVTFNGIAATVVSATANKLVVTIPAGATTGQLSITTPAGTTASAFVIAAIPIPTITNISPTIGAAGTSVTVTGTAFESTAATNNVSFNMSFASLGTVSSTQIIATVPPEGTSGHIAVATPRGTAVSTQDFFVAPAPNVAADVLVANRLPFSTDTVVTLGTAGKIGLLIFDLTASQRASLSISSGTITSSVIRILDPYGGVARTATVGASGFLDTVPAGMPGTYTVLVDPQLSYTGSTTLKLYDVPADVSGTITPGGSAVVTTTTVPGQNAGYSFTATAGQRVSLRFTSSTYNLCNVSIVAAAGESFLASSAAVGTTFVDTATLPTAGPYKLVLDPFIAATGTITTTMYDVPPDVTGTISVGGASVPVAITTPGQNGLLTFSGTAGQRVSLTMSSPVLTSGTTTIRKPDQSTLVFGAFGGTTLIEPVILATTGTYSVFVDPLINNTGTVTLTLNSVPADITGSIVPGGASVGVTIAAPGQIASLTFSGSAGQRVALHSTTGPVGFLKLLKPDSTTLASTTTGGAVAFIDTTVLPTTGTYTVVVDPSVANTGTLTVTLYDVPADLTATLTIGAAATPVTFTGVGQKGSYTFSGTASQQVTVRITSNAVGFVNVKLLRPDGTTMTQSTTSGTSFNLTTQTLPSTGTYTVVIDPSTTNVGTLNVQVTTP